MTSQGDLMKITDSKNFRILGTNLQQNLNWQKHLETGTKAVLPIIRKKLGALKQMGKQLPPTTRKLLAEGLIISKLIYMITQWGGATQNCRTQAQRTMNQAARWVCNSNRRTRVSKLLLDCNWMSVNDLTTYHSLIQLWKIVRLNRPENFENFAIDNSDKIQITEPRLQFTLEGFRWRTSADWNELPTDVRKTMSLPVFKRKVKQWIKLRRTEEPD